MKSIGFLIQKYFLQKNRNPSLIGPKSNMVPKDEICAPLERYTAYSGNSLPTFRYHFQGYEDRTGTLSRNVGEEVHYKPLHVPEERRSHLLCVGSLKAGKMPKISVTVLRQFMHSRSLSSSFCL